LRMAAPLIRGAAIRNDVIYPQVKPTG